MVLFHYNNFPRFLLLVASMTLLHHDSGPIGCFGFLSLDVVRYGHVVGRQTRNTLIIPSSVTSATTEESIDKGNDKGLISITVPPFHEDKENDDNCMNQYPSLLHKIHIQTNFLTSQEASKCLEYATQFATSTGRWNQPDKDRHQTYSTCDFAIEESEDLASYLEEIQFQNRMWTQLSDLYGIDTQDMSYIDFFCANYEARNDKDDKNQNNNHGSTMDRLEEHRDGSLLSFTVVLTPPDQFEGGGTFFDALRDVSPLSPQEESVLYPPMGAIRVQNAGDSVMHSGKLLHGADVVTSGTRTVLVGFVDVADWCQREGVLAEACRDFGRMDVAASRHRRQIKRTQNEKLNGWTLNNKRWLPQPSQSKSYLTGFVPAFPSVTRRANPEYQRRQKLQAEDILLRNILLPKDERNPTGIPLELFGGELPPELFGDAGEITFL